MITFLIIHWVIGILTAIALAKYEYPDGFTDNVTYKELFGYIIWTFAGFYFAGKVLYSFLNSDDSNRKAFK